MTKSATKSVVKGANAAAAQAPAWHNEEIIGNGITYNVNGKEYISIAFDQPYTNAQGKQVPGVNLAALAAELNSGKRLSLQPLKAPMQLKNGGVRTHVIALRARA